MPDTHDVLFEAVLVSDATLPVNIRPDDGDRALAQLRNAGVRTSIGVGE